MFKEKNKCQLLPVTFSSAGALLRTMLSVSQLVFVGRRPVLTRSSCLSDDPNSQANVVTYGCCGGGIGVGDDDDVGISCRCHLWFDDLRAE